MTPFLIILAALFALVLVMFLIGLLLPESHSASTRATYRQSPQTIWAALTDWREMPTWRSGVKSVEERETDASALSWVETTGHGKMPFEVVESVPSQRLVLRIADKKLPFGGTWTYVLESGAEGKTTRLTVTEDGEIYNALFRFMAKAVFGYHATMKTYLKDLGDKFGDTQLHVESL